MDTIPVTSDSFSVSDTSSDSVWEPTTIQPQPIEGTKGSSTQTVPRSVPERQWRALLEAHLPGEAEAGGIFQRILPFVHLTWAYSLLNDSRRLKAHTITALAAYEANLRSPVGEWKPSDIENFQSALSLAAPAERVSICFHLAQSYALRHLTAETLQESLQTKDLHGVHDDLHHMQMAAITLTEVTETTVSDLFRKHITVQSLLQTLRSDHTQSTVVEALSRVDKYTTILRDLLTESHGGGRHIVVYLSKEIDALHQIVEGLEQIDAEGCLPAELSDFREVLRISQLAHYLRGIAYERMGRIVELSCEMPDHHMDPKQHSWMLRTATAEALYTRAYCDYRIAGALLEVEGEREVTAMHPQWVESDHMTEGRRFLQGLDPVMDEADLRTHSKTLNRIEVDYALASESMARVLESISGNPRVTKYGIELLALCAQNHGVVVPDALLSQIDDSTLLVEESPVENGAAAESDFDSDAPTLAVPVQIEQPPEDAKERARYVEDLVELAEAHIGRDNLLSGIRVYEKIVKLMPASIEHQYTLAQLYGAVDNHKAAVDTYELLMALAPSESKYWMDLGRLFTRMGNNQQALVHLTRAELKKPEDGALQATIGDNYLALKNFSEAERRYRKAIELDPDNAHFRRGLYHCCVKAGNYHSSARNADYKKAVAYYQTAYGLFPNHGGGYFNRHIEALDRLGRYDEAVALYERLCEQFPGRSINIAPRVYSDIADRAYRQQDYGAAAHLFQTALRLAPGNVYVQRMLSSAFRRHAMNLVKQGSVKEAIEYLRKSVDKTLLPSPESHVNLAEQLVEGAREQESSKVELEEALEHLTTAIRSRGGEDYLYHLKSMAESQLGRDPTASLKMALKYDPQSRRYARELYQWYADHGDEAQAATYRAKYVDLGGDPKGL